MHNDIRRRACSDVNRPDRFLHRESLALSRARFGQRCPALMRRRRRKTGRVRRWKMPTACVWRRSSVEDTAEGAAHIWKRNRRTSPWWHPYVGRNCRIVYNEEHMEDPNLTTGPGSDVDSTRGSSPAQIRQPVDESLQKLLDKAPYGGGHPSAQKIRNFLNGTWLGEPLHVVLKDVPVGAWTVAMVFDALDLIFNRSEFARACETSIGIGLVGAAGAG